MPSPKRLLNSYEAIVNERLLKICEDCEAHVFPKVRVADVLPIEGSGIDSDLYRFALQGHFDFVVTDLEPLPLFAVEFDGPFHSRKIQAERDQKKDHLCEIFEFPLLRINARYLTTSPRGMDLLTWLVETWFNSRAFYEAQEKGMIPWDEDFCPWSLMEPGGGSPLPYHLSLDALNRLRRLYKEGMCRDPTVSHWIGEDQRGRLIGIGWLRITDTEGVIIRTGIKAKDFGFYLSELLDDLVMLETVAALDAVLEGSRSSTSVSQMMRYLDDWTAGAKMFRTGGMVDTLAIGERTRIELR